MYILFLLLTFDHGVYDYILPYSPAKKGCVAALPKWRVSQNLVINHDFHREDNTDLLSFLAPRILPSCGTTILLHCFDMYMQIVETQAVRAHYVTKTIRVSAMGWSALCLF